MFTFLNVWIDCAYRSIVLHSILGGITVPAVVSNSLVFSSQTQLLLLKSSCRFFELASFFFKLSARFTSLMLSDILKQLLRAFGVLQDQRLASAAFPIQTLFRLSSRVHRSSSRACSTFSFTRFCSLALFSAFFLCFLSSCSMCWLC